MVKLTTLAQTWIAEHLPVGGTALDATVGNGHDTCFLAKTVGAGGRVIGVDIQARALLTTRRRLIAARLSDRVRLIRTSHRSVVRFLADARGGIGRPAPGDGSDSTRLDAVMFNLGYLPGRDKMIRTIASDTIAALDQVRQSLAAGGVISVIAYPGHPGGAAERDAVAGWFDRQDRRHYRIEPPMPGSDNPDSPILFRLRDRSDGALHL